MFLNVPYMVCVAERSKNAVRSRSVALFGNFVASQSMLPEEIASESVPKNVVVRLATAHFPVLSCDELAL
jgi:hypothetical protein